MLKHWHELIWTYDSEWIPDATIGRRLYSLPEDLSEIDVMTAMFSHAKDFDPEKNPRPFLKTILCRPLTIALVIHEQRWNGAALDVRARIRVGVAMHDDSKLVRGFLASVGQQKPMLVGYNSREADLPVLIERTLVHGLSGFDLNLAAFFHRPEKPWRGVDYFEKFSGWHLDLMDYLGGGFRDTPSLSQACAALNIIGPKDTTGADVLDLYLDGRIEDIGHYCASDAVRQYLILLRIGEVTGNITPDVSQAVAQQVLDQLDNRSYTITRTEAPTTSENHEDQAPLADHDQLGNEQRHRGADHA